MELLFWMSDVEDSPFNPFTLEIIHKAHVDKKRELNRKIILHFYF